MLSPSSLRRTGALIVALVSIGACGGGDPTAPEEPVPNVAGAWTGSAEDTYDQIQVVNLYLQQAGSDLSGSIHSMIFRTAVIFPLTGSVDQDGNVTLQVLAADDGGCFDVTINVAVSTSGRRLSGTYVIDRKADGCGRIQVGGSPPRPFNLGQ